MDEIEDMTLLETVVVGVTGFATLVLTSTLGYYWDIWLGVREQLW